MAIKTNLKMQYERDLRPALLRMCRCAGKSTWLRKSVFFVLGFIYKKTQVKF